MNLNFCVNYAHFRKSGHKCGTPKTSDKKGIRFVTVSQIGMSSVPQVRVGIVGRAMRLVSNHTHFHAIQE